MMVIFISEENHEADMISNGSLSKWQTTIGYESRDICLSCVLPLESP